MSKLKTGLVSIGAIVLGIVTLRAFRKRRSGTDDIDSLEEEGEAESFEDEAKSLGGEAEPPEEEGEVPETAAEHAEVAAEHALLAIEKSVKSRMEDKIG